MTPDIIRSVIPLGPPKRSSDLLRDIVSNRFRSANWWEADGIDGFLQRTAMKVQGFREEDFSGKPVIGICNNWSEFTRCHLHFNALVDAVKRGVWQAGGFPREFNTMTMGADLARPVGISFMHRNLLAMEVEQIARTYPVDGLVVLGACDETIPGMLMAAASVDLPTILLPGGPGLNGRWRGETVGSSTDCHRLFADFRAGKLTPGEWRDVETSIERSPGHCTTMGTASTMACLGEVLGMAPSGSAALPAVDSRRLTMAQMVGQRAVAIVREDLRPSLVMTRSSFENAIRVLASLAGSTNAIIHLLALAGRLGVELPLALFDELSRDTPVLVNLKPSGQFLMEDFFYAGGVPALVSELAPLLNLDLPTAMGTTLRQACAEAVVLNREVIAAFLAPLSVEGGVVILSGNIAPGGAVLKQSAASPSLLKHTGRAVVFENHGDLEALLDSPELNVHPDDVLVLKNGGPKGAPGMPEWGNIPLPQKILRLGIRDMVRVSDSRMSGTAFGTTILHVAPEAATGGTLGLVESGDLIELDVGQRRVELLVEDREVARRRARRKARLPEPTSGYERLYIEHVLQANEGCDFDFLRSSRPATRE